MWIPIQLNEQSAEPLYYQIEVQLRALIVSGQLAEGTLLPSIRELAKTLKCSVITVRRVYQDLENEGLLRTRQGTGTFVAKVGDEERRRHRTEAVVETLESAVDTGLQVGCGEAELRKLFDEVLSRKLADRPERPPLGGDGGNA
ncbi:MAG TPA: GntR family transcriptional regulator [Paenibacillus sp.]|uniref:GntR family transcriptional regulator n=1 Tax=Paenibacillus sp. TaxID=58172 RepID=UPI0028D4D040|nr:GntR family transcriptional regulator [Paenibacillus sp.]HUC91492.1 GntR family transcriptional regulator [Paenibacillus sp.]